jgi:small subunit ribosomal protein S18
MARPRTRRKDAAAERKPKKKVSILDSEQITWIDYKDVNLLRRFMSERAKIRARRVTGNDSQQQRAVARAIRVAREMALLPYSVRQVTHRNKGKGRGDREGRDTRDLAPMPEPGAPEDRVEIEELSEETIDLDVLAGDDEGTLGEADEGADDEADEVTT